jgi:hypothetical protein
MSLMIPKSFHPVTFSVEYPERELDRFSTLLRPILAIPILIVLATVLGLTTQWRGENGTAVATGTGGLLVLGPLLMIVFRQKYPRWWFDWNLELLRFASRVGV